MRHPAADRDPRLRAGFTLVEITIAMGVFAVGMLALAAMQLHAMRAGGSGRHATQAAAIAQSRMEQLQRLRWTDLATTGGAFTAPVLQDDTVQGTPGGVEMTYAVDWRVADVEVGWTRSLDVRVSWDEPKRPGRTVVLSSMRYNREGP